MCFDTDMVSIKNKYDGSLRNNNDPDGHIKTVTANKIVEK
jgi:hypothetical protein